MAVRLRPQSSAWMAPHALAAQLTAQTGQIAASGPQALLAGLSQGVGAFTQKREQRRAEAINESRYQDSLGFRQEEMALRKQAADREDAEGRYAILSQAAKGAENKAALWQLANPGQPLPPELMQESEQLKSALRAITSQFAKGVPSAQAVAERQAPASGAVVNGKSMSQMTDAELNDVMAKSERGEVDVTYRGGATGDMGQGVGGQPAAAPSTPAAEAAPAPVDGLSSGDPMADRFTDAIGKTMKQIEVMEARADAIDSVAGRKGIESSKLRSQIAEAKTQLLILQGRYQVYSEDRKRKAQAEETRATQAADDTRTDAREHAAVAKWNAAHPDRQITSTKEIGPQYADQRLDQTQAFKRETIDKMERRAKWQAEFRRQAAIELENIRAANREPAAQSRALEAAKQEQKSRMAAAKNRYDTLRKMYDDNKELGVEFYGDATTPSAWDLYEAEREKYFAMTEAAQAPASAPAAAGGGDPMASAEEEYNNLPDAEKTPEAAARIAAKYGIK